MRLTQVAHSVIEKCVNDGDIVIDATAGNGHDTLFLSQLVGAHGRVYAFDVQSQAIESTHDRLQKSLPEIRVIKLEKEPCSSTPAKTEPSGVYLVHDCHALMNQYIDRRDGGKIAAATFNLGYLPTKFHSKTASNLSNEKKDDPPNSIRTSTNKPQKKMKLNAVSEKLSDCSTTRTSLNFETPGITRPSTTVLAIKQSLALLKPGGCVTVLAYLGHPGGQEEADAVCALMQKPIDGISWQELNRNMENRQSPRLFVARKNTLA